MELCTPTQGPTTQFGHHFSSQQTQNPAKIGGRRKTTKNLPGRADTSTQPSLASGRLLVPTSSSDLPTPTGRTTRTARKAAQPLTPTNSPPTHLGQFKPAPVTAEIDPTTHPTEPRHTLFPNLPSISQLRDYPNISHPLPSKKSSVIVTLPNSAPSSPISIPYSYLNVDPGDPVTPAASP